LGPAFFLERTARSRAAKRESTGDTTVTGEALASRRAARCQRRSGLDRRFLIALTGHGAPRRVRPAARLTEHVVSVTRSLITLRESFVSVTRSLITLEEPFVAVTRSMVKVTELVVTVTRSMVKVTEHVVTVTTSIITVIEHVITVIVRSVTASRSMATAIEHLVTVIARSLCTIDTGGPFHEAEVTPIAGASTGKPRNEVEMHA
jgi:hypothetical protein